MGWVELGGVFLGREPQTTKGAMVVVAPRWVVVVPHLFDEGGDGLLTLGGGGGPCAHPFVLCAKPSL